MYPYVTDPRGTHREAFLLLQEVEGRNGQRAIRAVVDASSRLRWFPRVDSPFLRFGAIFGEQKRVIVLGTWIVGFVPHHRRQAAPRHFFAQIHRLRSLQNHRAVRVRRPLQNPFIRHRHAHRLSRAQAKQRLLRLHRPRLVRHVLLRVA